MSKISDLTIPMMGSVENARLLKWFIDEGAPFSKGDVLYELETDKTVTEVQADSDGILARQLGAEGDDFKMGDRIGLQAPAGTSADEIASALAAAEGSSPAAPEASAPATAQAIAPPPKSGVMPVSSTLPVKSSPRSRRLAREHNIDIASVTPTGPRGRVTGEDVLKAAAARDQGVAAPTQAAAPAQAAAPVAASPAPVSSLPEVQVNEGEATIVPHSLRRKTIARNLATAKREAPHLTADMDIDLTALMALRKRIKSSGQPAPSILAYFATTAARLLTEHKTLNATFRENDSVLWNSVNLNIGVDTDEGLVVPVIRDAQLLTAAEMTVKIADTANKARNGELTPADMSGGTFTISNPGSLGPVVRAEAVLNGPQVAIMGMPGIVKKPVAIEMPDGSYAIQVRPIIRIGVTFDHRALDGGPVIRFLNALKAAIEDIGV